MGHGICQMLAKLVLPRLPAEDLLVRMALPCLQLSNVHGPPGDHLRQKPMSNLVSAKYTAPDATLLRT